MDLFSTMLFQFSQKLNKCSEINWDVDIGLKFIFPQMSSANKINACEDLLWPVILLLFVFFFQDNSICLELSTWNKTHIYRIQISSTDTFLHRKLNWFGKDNILGGCVFSSRVGGFYLKAIYIVVPNNIWRGLLPNLIHYNLIFIFYYVLNCN